MSDGEPIPGSGESGMVDPQHMFMEELSKMTPEQQKEFKEHISKIPFDQRAGLLKALGIVESGGEAQAERMKQPIDDAAKSDVAKASRELIPESEMSAEELKKHVDSISDLYNRMVDPETSTGKTEAAQFAQLLASVGFKRMGEGEDNTPIKDAIKQSFSALNDQQIEDIIEHLPIITQKEKEAGESMTEKEEEELGAKADALADVVQTSGDAQIQEIEREIQGHEKSGNSEEAARLKTLKNRLLNRINLFTRIKDFFGPDTKGRKWAKRAGKAIYFSLIALFLIIVLEMNAINKMARKQGR